MILVEPALADPAPFDLSGPGLRISVTRSGVTLPIAAVPQLAPGDRVVVETALPPNETAHYVLITAFLRDSTNPPPDIWFARSESWKSTGRGGGPIALIVPGDANHLALFLAPQTQGGFSTLRKAVETRPGAFVRAAQDLEQASLDRLRYDAYLASIRKLATATPDALAHAAPIVANSLRIKINESCLQRQPEFQAPCLLDTKQSVVLGSDGASDSNALTGAATDLALSLSATPVGGLGYYSPYISAIRELIGIFGAMRSARFQYIPALGVADGSAFQLLLNSPPSFANPRSVMMAVLPEVKLAPAPALQLEPSAAAACLGTQSVLPLAIGPLFYATGYAHDLLLRVKTKDGSLDLPLSADPAHGGLVMGVPVSLPSGISGLVTAQVQGRWGFDPLTGPEITLQTAGDWRWQARDGGKGQGSLTLTGAPAACVSAVNLASGPDTPKPLEWKVSGADEIAVVLPLTDAKPHPVTIAIAGPVGVDAARVTIEPPAKAAPPTAVIIAHGSRPTTSAGQRFVPIILDSPDEIAAGDLLNFTLKAAGNGRFSGRETVEVKTVDGEATARLTLGSGLTLVDSGILVASLLPAQALGTSAFGPLRARLLQDGEAGEWLPLGTLVRLPHLTKFACPPNRGGACSISGDGLYLLASVSASIDFEGATSVPEGYPGFTLAIPRPAGTKTLFVRLHDAPELVNRIDVSAGAAGHLQD